MLTARQIDAAVLRFVQEHTRIETDSPAYRALVALVTDLLEKDREAREARNQPTTPNRASP